MHVYLTILVINTNLAIIFIIKI